jgi:2-methylisocitrate lyase-like PEP mutase family enzyme
MPQTQRARIDRFRQLHESGTFVLPNPWDVGSALFLAQLGFKALATTSAGVAFALGKPDADWAVPRDAMLAHIRAMAQTTDLPVNADYESGYAHDPAGVAENVRMCIAAGIAGLSIEDATGERTKPLYDIDRAVERIRGARQAVDASGLPVVLTARAECWLVGHPDPLRESIARLVAYAEAGADCLYAPGVRAREDIAALVKAVAPKPLNVLVGAPGLSVRDLADLGVRRVSVGSALARTAWGAFMRAAREIAGRGTFEAFAGAVPFAEINEFFRGPR